MRTKLLAGCAAALVLTLLPALAVSASDGGAAPPDPNQATLTQASSPYGPIMVVGGAGAGYVPATMSKPAHYNYPAGSSVYFPTVDPPTFSTLAGHSYNAGCTTTVVSGTAFGNVSCTGTESDPHADWPAFTTDKAPIAGPGIDPTLLGSVYRADLGTYQVTYAGHPLYLFAPGAHNHFGANFYETVLPLPPEHTAWYLVSHSGLPATGRAVLETESPQSGTTYSTTELAVEMLPRAVPGGAAVSAYSYSNPSTNHCVAGCSRFMMPVLTVGAPIAGTGVNPAAIGTVKRGDGSMQVTYNGQPLYIYSQEQLLPGSGGGPGTTGTAGNGDGATFNGGTFSLVTP